MRESFQEKWLPRFIAIWSGQTVSLIGTGLVQFALIWWLTVETGSAKVLALATGVSIAPAIVVGPIAGTLVDRWSRRQVLIFADGLAAAATVVLALLFWMGSAQPWHVYLLMLVRSFGQTFHLPAMLATTPLLVPTAHLPRVAGANRSIDGIVMFIAPPLGAFLLGAIGIQLVLLIDIVSAAVAILPLLVVRIPELQRSTELVRGPKAVLRDTVEGFQYVWSNRGLRLMLFTAAVWSLLAYAPGVAFPPLLVTQHFGGGAKELGFLQAAFGGAAVLGGVLLAAWGGFRSKLKTSIVGTFGMGIGLTLMAAAPKNLFLLGVIGYAIAGFAFPVHSGGLQALYQKVVPSNLHGRFFSLNQMVFLSMGPLSLAISGTLAEIIGVRPFYWFYAIAALLIASIRLVSPAAKKLETDVEPPPSDAA